MCAALFGHGRIARRLDARVLRHRDPELGGRRRHGKIEARRGDADDGEAASIDGQRVADRIRHTAKVIPPELVADDDDVRSGSLLFLAKAAAQVRFHTEGREQIRGDDRARHVPRGSSPGDGEAGGVVSGHRHQRLRVPAPVERSPATRPSAARGVPRQIGFVDRHQLLGRGKRQRPKDHRAHHAEHRRVGADAEAERQDRGNGEGRRLPQRAACVEQVLPEMLNRRPAPRVAHGFSHEQHVAELTPGGGGRLLR